MSSAEIAVRLRAARFENGAALLLGSQFVLPSGVMRWAHLGIAQLMRERVVHRLWTRATDPHWSRICSFYELLPLLIDGSADSCDDLEAGAAAVISLQGCHPGRFSELLLNEDVSLWMVAGLGPEDEALHGILQRLPADRVLLVGSPDIDGFFDGLAREFGGISFAPAYDVTPAERLRQAALAQMLRKMTREEQIAEFDRSLQSAAVTQATRGQTLLQEALTADVAAVSMILDSANRAQEIACRLLPSAEGLAYWGRALQQVADRLTGLRAARVYRAAAEKLRRATRLDAARPRLFNEWVACMQELARHTPREAARAVQFEIDREFQWRIAHGVALDSAELVRWAKVLTEWSALTPGDEAKRLFNLARTRIEEAKRRAASQEPVELTWADLLRQRALHTDPAEGRRLLEEALTQLAGSTAEVAFITRARCYFQLAVLSGSSAGELIRKGDQAIEGAMESGMPRAAAHSVWGGLYVELAEIRAKQSQPDAAGYLAYGQGLFAEVQDYKGWSESLLSQTRIPQLAVQNQPKRQILETAREKALEAESRAEGTASFDLARLAAALRDEAACKGWLAKAQRLRSLPPLTALLEEPEFSSYRQKPWFRELTGV